MDQPEFGIELVKIRKSKGLTQSELAEKCDLTYRTIQRIESGKVMPRSYTIKALSAALDFDFQNYCSLDVSGSRRVGHPKTVFVNTILIQFKDLFNLKTNTMKKVTLLSIILGLTVTGLFVLTHESKAQRISNASVFSIPDSIRTISSKEAIKMIKDVNRKAMFHNNSIDVIETYAKKSSYNYDTYVIISELIGNFGHSTKPAMEIANIVFLTNKKCDLFNEIVPLIFLNNHNCNNYVKMAKDASEATTEYELNRIKEQINKYKQQADFKSLTEAYNKQE